MTILPNKHNSGHHMATEEDGDKKHMDTEIETWTAGFRYS